jgi:aromatic-L-amino-acid decarboxylase
MDPEVFRAAAHRVADQVADYLADLERFRVLPDLRPGEVRAQLPAAPPSTGEPIEAILDDYTRLIEPNVTHWQHPGFLAYFASVASGPGILGEWLASGLNSNVMLWRNAPASTELEEVVVGWLRDLLGLPSGLDGMLTDTASISTLLSLVVARERAPAGTRLRLYGSEEMHSSIDKGAIVAGIGREGVRRIPVDDVLRMRPDLLRAAIEEDRRQGWTPFCVVATAGTTSSTSLDPVDAAADVCVREGLWLHVDAAYGGAAALLPEMRPLFAGWERADSIVVNPHKWMWTPFDASLLLFRDPLAYRAAFSLVPEYLRTEDTGGVHNYNEYGVQLGRRFRALKLWFLLRWFGVEGMQARLREHLRLARGLAAAVDGHPDWELLAPVPLATVCLRHRPAGFRGPEETLDAANQAILDRVNASGRIFLSHTRLRGRFTIRVSIGNPRTTEVHVDRCWELLRAAAEGIGGVPAER